MERSSTSETLSNTLRSALSDNIASTLTLVILLSSTLFYSIFLSNDLAIGIPPDEVAQLSKILEVKAHFPQLNPTRERLCSSSGEPTNNPNYLAHPPLYYWIAGLLTDKHDCSIINEYKKFRHLSILLTSFALLFLLWAISKCISLKTATLIYLLFVTSIPTLPYLAASPNNDSAALLFFSLLIFSWTQIYKSRDSQTPYIFLALSLTLCLLTKATTGLQAAIFSLVMLLLSERELRSSLISLKPGKIALIAILFIPLIFYIYLKLRYGTFLPSASTLAGYYWQKTEPTKDFLQYAAHFFDALKHSLTGISSGDSLKKTKFIQYYGMALILFISLTQIFTPPQQKDLRFLWTLYLSSIITIIVFMITHFVFVYAKYRTYGYPGGIQFRYYLPLTLVAATGYILWHVQTTKLRQTLVILLVIPSLVWGNMFFYLQQKKSGNPSPTDVEHVYFSYIKNSVTIKGNWNSCTNTESPKLLVNYKGKIFAALPKQKQQKAFSLQLSLPVSCRQYLHKLEDVEVVLHCGEDEKKSLLLINQTDC